jgi:phosphonate transport system substrate-binding protein
LVIARPGLDAEVQENFVNAMLRLNELEHRAMLRHLYGPDGYVPADAVAFDGVRALARRYGLLQ